MKFINVFHVHSTQSVIPPLEKTVLGGGGETWGTQRDFANDAYTERKPGACSCPLFTTLLDARKNIPTIHSLYMSQSRRSSFYNKINIFTKEKKIKGINNL